MSEHILLLLGWVNAPLASALIGGGCTGHTTRSSNRREHQQRAAHPSHSIHRPASQPCWTTPSKATEALHQQQVLQPGCSCANQATSDLGAATPVCSGRAALAPLGELLLLLLQPHAWSAPAWLPTSTQQQTHMWAAVILCPRRGAAQSVLLVMVPVAVILIQPLCLKDCWEALLHSSDRRSSNRRSSSRAVDRQRQQAVSVQEWDARRCTAADWSFGSE